MAMLVGFLLAAGKGFAQAEPAETGKRQLEDGGLVGVV